ncbi:hypothetical protein Godav_010657 [Gossypium davidsonii]|uniref:Uncharacterized protein n=1 Tax=Gossypium davidsonii TaxID=34287 RepID=A0A7J8SIQ2_GOSDV|nr:hypothetical protein [Gossypium davidsonii]
MIRIQLHINVPLIFSALL